MATSSKPPIIDPFDNGYRASIILSVSIFPISAMDMKVVLFNSGLAVAKVTVVEDDFPISKRKEKMEQGLVDSSLRRIYSVAKILFLDFPAGIGFSYFDTTSDLISHGDKRTA